MKRTPKGPGPSGNARRERVAHALREALIEAIAADVRDPRVHAGQMLTVTRVELNVDMAVANVYVSIVGDDATAEAAVVGLQKAAGFLRGPIGRTVGLQHAPELRFQRDVSIDMRDKLAEILREDEEKARAAGRDLSGSDTSEKKP
jgi:ribosome-binding factor A